MKRIAVLLTSLILTACNAAAPPPRVAVAPALGDELLWARKDGRRMATNPQLYEQGTLDKQRCTEEASMSGALDFPLFSSCMDRAGYVPMRRNT
jgi:hypothetical protein